jgi:transcriptional regulator with PAS, ATPase and Fis domain
MFRSAILGDSTAVREMRAVIMRVAASDSPVLVQGETGVGKELVAVDIHQRSDRHQGPFVAVDCPAIVESLFEAELFGIESGVATGVRSRKGKLASAHGGTLFLDEIADLSAAGQGKLLRVLQESAVCRVGSLKADRVNIRIVAASNRSLRELVSKGLFREDLYFRLSGLEVDVPPLRERRADIVPLVRHFASEIQAKPVDVSAAATTALERYPWPGNVRELRRTVECALAFGAGGRIETPHLPPRVRRPLDEILVPSLCRGDTLREWAASYVALTLDRCGGNKRNACKTLGISYHTLQAHLARSAARDSCSDTRLLDQLTFETVASDSPSTPYANLRYQKGGFTCA